MPKMSLRRLVQQDKPLITPLAYDALSARLIARAGFQAMGIGGSGLLAARYGLPDVGIAALGEMAAGIADIVAATDLPVMVDGDDGYGDVKSVVRMMEVYGRLGVSGVVLEDQLRDAKRPGDSGAIGVASIAEMSGKLKAAAAARPDPEIQIIARCDAYKPEGIDAAIRRAEAYLAAGADGVFIPSVQHAEELRQIGAAFRGQHLVAAMFEGRDTWMPPSELYAMGFTQLVFPGLLFSRVVHALDQALGDFRAFADGRAPMPPLADAARAEGALKEAVGLARWDGIHAGQSE
jgi:2-methylisocitrate lyase-like PEP mutase family enzyme